MDDFYPDMKNNQAYTDPVGHSLNMGVNALADELHWFYLNKIKQYQK